MSSRKYTEVAGNSGGLNYKAIGCLVSCLSLILVGIVLTVYNYHRTVMDEREETDIRNTSIYEPFLDKYTPVSTTERALLKNHKVITMIAPASIKRNSGVSTEPAKPDIISSLAGTPELI